MILMFFTGIISEYYLPTLSGAFIAMIPVIIFITVEKFAIGD